ncbi:hypothetical protein I4U23_030853 [Adineta vaga]|nr:hypothetical protein I4U23_030853 [Adineta vaga]
MATSSGEMKKIYFITSNKKKLEEVNDLLGSHPKFELIAKDIDLDEYQGEPEKISIKKCKAAQKMIDGPVLIEDVSLCFNALKELPGPYIKWFVEDLKLEGLSKILVAYEDKRATAKVIFAYGERDKNGEPTEPKLFIGTAEGTIVMPRPGSYAKDDGWDPIFQPKGETETYGEMTKERKNEISYRRVAIDKIIKHFA